MMVVQLESPGEFVPVKVPDEEVSNLADALLETNLGSYGTYTLVDSCAGVADLVDILKGLAEPVLEDFYETEDLPISQPSLYIDLKKSQSSHYGSYSTMQILASPNYQTFLVNIQVLGEEAFSTPGKSGETLRGILESACIPKVFFDVRYAAHALFAGFQVEVCRVTDLQLMEVATRGFSHAFLSTLAECIEEDLHLSQAEISLFRRIERKGRSQLSRCVGESCEAFNFKPLTEDLCLYLIQDVQFMPDLFEQYLYKITESWAAWVRWESRQRAYYSPSESNDSQRDNPIRGPEGWGGTVGKSRRLLEALGYE